VNFVTNYSAGHSLAVALKEAQIQGVTPKVWLCTTACYSQAFLDEAGDAAEGTYVWVPGIPLEEKNLNKATATMVKAIGDDIDGFATLAWSAGLIFRDAVNAAVDKGGVNALTRANLLEALRGIHDFTADGMTGTIDIGNGTGSSCFAIVQVRDGKFVRVYPKKKLELDCRKSNVVTTKYDNET
jgi:ABC-type branched-subunit amino acid transport system substrate-binding protein